jgi:hypothetical protein
MGRFWAALLLCGATTIGCAGLTTTPARPARADALTEKLEPSFVALVAQRPRNIDEAERFVASIELLRSQYVVAIGRATDDNDRAWLLLRVAELHLHGAARVRRIRYASGIDRDAFDATLSSLALPLEATGSGVLQQLISRGDALADERPLERARLYLSFLAGDSLDAGERQVLLDELRATRRKAPRTLLEAGRLGQRAAR